MGPIVCGDTSRKNYRCSLRNIPKAHKSSVDISLFANDHQNDVFRRISQRYYKHTDLIQDTTACFKILARIQDRLISKSASFIYYTLRSFPLNAPRFPKGHFEDSQASPVCPCCKTNI
jgi:hypothetical protein